MAPTPDTPAGNPRESDHPELREIVAAFAVAPVVAPIVPLGKGLINDTFAVTTRDGRYVLQRVNLRVFPRAEAIMSNLTVLAAHAAGRAGLRVPALLPASDGQPFLRTQDGRPVAAHGVDSGFSDPGADRDGRAGSPGRQRAGALPSPGTGVGPAPPRRHPAGLSPDAGLSRPPPGPAVGTLLGPRR